MSGQTMNMSQLFSAINPFAQKPPVDPSKPNPGNPMQDQNNIPAFDKGQNPNASNPGGKPAEPQSPLDNFKDLFTLTDDDKKRMESNDPSAPIFSVDPTKLAESVGKMSFVDPQQMQQQWNAALKGDSNALAELLNGVARQIYSKSAQLSANLSERAATSTAENIRSDLPNRFREFSAGEGLQQINPAYNHPALKPVVEGLKSQFLVKYPNASSGELTKMINDYMDAMFSARGGKPAAPDNGNRHVDPRNPNGADYDWGKSFFGNP